MQTQAAQRDILWRMADGRIAIKVMGDGTEDRVLLFDPARLGFTVVVHPEGRQMRMIRGRPDGTILVWSSPGCRLEVFDGKAFHVIFNSTVKWSGYDVRSLVEKEKGEFWFGGADALAVIKDGELSTLKPKRT